MEELDSVENGYNRLKVPVRWINEKPKNDPNALCRKCGINKVKVAMMNGRQVVYRDCVECKKQYVRDYKRRVNDTAVKPQKWYKRLYDFIKNLFVKKG